MNTSRVEQDIEYFHFVTGKDQAWIFFRQQTRPEERTSCIGKTFFSYVTPLIKLGNHKVLEYEDLPNLSYFYAIPEILNFQ